MRIQNVFKKIKNKKLLLVPMLLGALMSFQSVTLAQSSIWTCVGSTLAPDEGSLNNYLVDDAMFLHKGTIRGPIVGRANVTNPVDSGGNPQWDTLEVFYRDPDDELPNDDQNQVVVTLERTRLVSGESVILATFDSDTFPLNNNFQKQSVPFSHTFNFSQFAYFINVEVSRHPTNPLTTKKPIVAYVRLKNTP